MYLDLVRRHDPANELAGELVDRFPITILSDPPGAEVHLFRMVEQSEIVADGEPRMVPLPVRHYDWSMGGITPGDFALRVTDGGATLNEGDLIIDIRDPSQAGEHGLPIRDRVFVISAPESSAIRPFDRLVAIGEHVVRSMYDVRAALANEATQDGKRAFVFEQGFTPETHRAQITLNASNLEDLHVQVGDAADALHKAGGRVRVWRTGDVQTLDIPPCLRFETTSKPLYVGEQSRFGVTPMNGIEVERGQYVALLIKDRYEPLRVPITANDQSADNSAQLQVWKLLPRGSTPAGFVPIARTIFPDPQPFWIMQREVTISEYLEFLNDPDTRAKIDASPTPILYPRSGGIMECGRDQDGTFTLGPEFQPDWPVLGVSWNDAMAYAEWMTQEWEEGIEASRHQGIKEGSSSMPGSLDASMPWRVEFDLPTHREWLCAWGCSDDNQFPWGMHFRPWWCASNYAREMPNPEPVMSYPIDESNLGVFDLAGSVSEWLNAWWIEERGQREFAGGSWGYGGYNAHDMFMLYGHNGAVANATSGTWGFRLVMRIRAKE
jgi:formylglycine-generating enzyme required for sulfatase activity